MVITLMGWIFFYEQSLGKTCKLLYFLELWSSVFGEDWQREEVIIIIITVIPSSPLVSHTTNLDRKKKKKEAKIISTWHSSRYEMLFLAHEHSVLHMRRSSELISFTQLELLMSRPNKMPPIDRNR